MTALFWLAVAIASAWGYVAVGRRIALAVGRATYRRADERFCENYPSLARDKKWRHRAVNAEATVVFWLSLFFWPVALLVIAVKGRVESIDFSPDNERLQQRIAELESELGMRNPRG